MVQFDSIVASILKEKYCRNGDLSTICAKSSSYMIWKNSLAARELIEKGSRWRVGNDRHIKIRHHRWLPTPNSFMVHPHLPNLSVEATVYKLLIPTEDGVVWNEGLIEANFWAKKQKPFKVFP